MAPRGGGGERGGGGGERGSQETGEGTRTGKGSVGWEEERRGRGE